MQGPYQQCDGQQEREEILPGDVEQELLLVFEFAYFRLEPCEQRVFQCGSWPARPTAFAHKHSRYAQHEGPGDPRRPGGAAGFLKWLHPQTP